MWRNWPASAREKLKKKQLSNSITDLESLQTTKSMELDATVMGIIVAMIELARKVGSKKEAEDVENGLVKTA